jgi:LysM repeat protein
VPLQDWRRYVAPAAFLAAVTVAVVLIRSGLESSPSTSTTTNITTTTRSLPKYTRVHAGDTLATISRRTHVSVKTLRKLNPHVKPTALFIGERIRLR